MRLTSTLAGCIPTRTDCGWGTAGGTATAHASGSGQSQPACGASRSRACHTATSASTRRVSACRDSSSGWRWCRLPRRQRPRHRRFRHRSTRQRYWPSRSTCMTFRLVRLVRFPAGDQPKVKSGKAAPTTGADWDPYLEARELEPRADSNRRPFPYQVVFDPWRIRADLSSNSRFRRRPFT